MRYLKIFISRPEIKTLLNYLKTAAFAEEYRWWPLPLFLLLLSSFQLGIFIMHVVHLIKEHGLSITWSEPAPRCSMFIYNPYRRWEVWRYLSYSLVHSGVGHILLNLVMQLFVGLPLEMSHGSARIGVVYISGVLAGSLATSSFDPNMYLAGASGGVYSLIAAHLASLTLNWKEDAMVIRQRVREGKISSVQSSTVYRLMRLLSVLIYAVCDTGYAMYSRFVFGAGTVGYLAHLAGAAAGLLVGISVLKNRRKETWEIYLRIISTLVIVALAVVSVVWNVEGDTVYQNYHHTNRTYFLQPDYTNIHNCSYFGYHD